MNAMIAKIPKIIGRTMAKRWEFIGPFVRSGVFLPLGGDEGGDESELGILSPRLTAA